MEGDYIICTRSYCEYIIADFSNLQGTKSVESFSKTLNYSVLLNGGITFLLFLIILAAQNLIMDFMVKDLMIVQHLWCYVYLQYFHLLHRL